MSAAVSVVTPAFGAEATIAAAVGSVLAQTHTDFEVVIAADDGTDYEAVLGRAGIADKRVRHVTTGGAETGSANARNVALKAARHRFAAALDADDRMAPNKLERGLEALAAHPLVTTGLSVEAPDGRKLRTVGCTGTTELLPGADYKFVNLSMDAMAMWDRQALDLTYEAGLARFADFEWMVRAFEVVDASLHIGDALHAYVKRAGSASNPPGASATYVTVKQLLKQRIEMGHYSFKSAQTRTGLLKFLKLSLTAERSYEAAAEENTGLLFEDHLEAILQASQD